MNKVNKILAILAMPFKKFNSWFFGMFKEQYELTVWFHTETTITDKGLKTVKRSKKTYILSAISKKTPTHIIGKDQNKKAFEIRTVEPFDYTITKTI